MGVGKTTIGKALASCLNLHFVDSDLEIENQYRRQNHKAKLKFIQFRNSDYNNTV